MEYGGEWNGWDGGYVLSTAKMALFIEKHNESQLHDEGKRKD